MTDAFSAAVSAAQAAQNAAATLSNQLSAATTQVGTLNGLLTAANAQVGSLTAQHVADQAKIAELEAELNPTPPPPLVRFPGDPGPGKTVVGAIVSGGAGTAASFEQANGVKLGAHRSYWSAGISDFAPSGPIVAYCKAEHAAGRLPQVSGKLDWTQTIAGAYDAQLKAFAVAIEALGKPVDVIVNHEPENDGQAPSLFRGEQVRIRNAFGRGLKCLSFGGSRMTYSWSAQAITKFGAQPDEWFPGPAADGGPTWDWCGLDHYAQTSGALIEDGLYTAALASVKKQNLPLAFTELGIRVSDPNGPAQLAKVFTDAIAAGCVRFIYYNSDVNSTSVGWVLSGPLLAAFVSLLKDARSYRPVAA